MKKIFIVYTIVMVLLYIYCLPNSNNVLIDVLKDSVVFSATSYMLICFYKMMKWIGYDELPILYIPAYKMLPFLFSVPLVIIATIGFIRTILTKDLIYASYLLPSIFYCMNSYKIYHTKIYNNL